LGLVELPIATEPPPGSSSLRKFQGHAVATIVQPSELSQIDPAMVACGTTD